MDEILEKLYRQPILDALEEADLDEVATMVRVREYDAGEEVFRRGDDPDSFYMISEGQFEALLDDDEGIRRRNLLYPGEFFGDQSLLNDEPRGLTVVATTNSEVLYIPRADFLTLLNHYPELDASLAAYGSEIEQRVNYQFEGRGENEIVIYFNRRHWIVLAQRMMKAFLILFGIMIALGVAYIFFEENERMQGQLALIGTMALLLPLGLAIWEYVDWYNDYYIVTNERVIHIERVFGLMHERYEAPLAKIQNVTVARRTPVGEVLGYGKVVVSTASQGGNAGVLVMDYMPNADTVAERIILELNQEKNVIAQSEREKKRHAVRTALGFEPRSENRPGEESSQPPAPPPTRANLGNVLSRFFRYLRPQTREQTGTTIIWRKHWLILLLNSAPAYFTMALLIAGLVALQFGLVEDQLENAAINILSAISLGLMVLNIIWLFWLYADWRNDLYILTSDAILDEEKNPLGFNKEVRRAPLDSIQDIRYYQNNPLLVWLKVGHLLIQTAGQDGNFTFNWVHKPAEVQYDIYQYMQARLSHRDRVEAAVINQEVLELLKIYQEETLKHPPPPPPPPPESPASELPPTDPNAPTRRNPRV